MLHRGGLASLLRLHLRRRGHPPRRKADWQDDEFVFALGVRHRHRHRARHAAPRLPRRGDGVLPRGHQDRIRPHRCHGRGSLSVSPELRQGRVGVLVVRGLPRLLRRHPLRVFRGPGPLPHGLSLPPHRPAPRPPPRRRPRLRLLRGVEPGGGVGRGAQRARELASLCSPRRGPPHGNHTERSLDLVRLSVSAGVRDPKQPVVRGDDHHLPPHRPRRPPQRAQRPQRLPHFRGGVRGGVLRAGGGGRGEHHQELQQGDGGGGVTGGYPAGVGVGAGVPACPGHDRSLPVTRRSTTGVFVLGQEHCVLLFRGLPPERRRRRAQQGHTHPPHGRGAVHDGTGCAALLESALAEPGHRGPRAT
mmetsp:Transcript_3100/g.6228  ORF Transcript_3100/g.6228 Transcript_3100/m.6228 type:complete len:360 (+) Transcript_3100:824-1903(+)